MAPVCIQDFKDYAQRTMENEKWLYIQNGATTQTTTRANTEVYQHYRLRPRLLVDVSKVDTWVEILMKTVNMPIGLCTCIYSKRRYFCVAKFLRIKPKETYSCG